MEEEKRIRKRDRLREGENVEVVGWDPGSAVGGQWNKASKLSKTALTGNFEGKWLHWAELISVCSFSDWGEICDGMATHCTRAGHTVNEACLNPVTLGVYDIADNTMKWLFYQTSIVVRWPKPFKIPVNMMSLLLQIPLCQSLNKDQWVIIRLTLRTSSVDSSLSPDPWPDASFTSHVNS